MRTLSSYRALGTSARTNLTAAVRTIVSVRAFEIGGGGQLTALAALAGLGLLVWSTLPIGAQTSVTLVSNTGQTRQGSLGLASYDLAQSFTTGSNTAGYKLTSVTAIFEAVAGTGPSITVSIRADSAGSPGSSVGTLTNPASFSNGSLTFSASGGGIDLNSGTTYWLVYDSEGSSGGSNTRFITHTTSGAENVTAAGWSIGDSGSFRGATTTGSWTSTAAVLRIAIQGYAKSAAAPAAVSPDPSNLARSAVQWEPVGGMHSVPARIGEISSNKPKDASASIDLSAIAASVREELRERSRGFYVTTLIESPGDRRHILANLDHELARGSPLLKVNIWHIYRRASTGINTIELLGEYFFPRKVNLLDKPVRICLPAPSRDADQARIAVRGRADQDWTILETTLKDGQLCAETTRVSWFVIVLAPEEAAA